MEKWKYARKDYIHGMKYKDIASKYGVSINTVKSWKKRHWSKDAPIKKGMHTKLKRDASKVLDELEDNNELTDKQKLFCMYYIQRFNATWAYQQAYGANYETSKTEGSRNLAKPNVKRQLSKLRAQQTADIYIDARDLIRELKKMAFSNIGDVIDAKSIKHMKWIRMPDDSGPYEDNRGKYRLDPLIDADTGQQAYYYETIVNLRDDIGDSSSIKSIRVDRGDVIVEMYDKQKALSMLLKYLEVNEPQNEDDTVKIIDDIDY